MSVIKLNNNQLELMTAAPHLIVSGEHGCGKTTLLNGLIGRLMRQPNSVVMLVDDNAQELAEAVEDVAKIFDKRQSQYDEVIRQAEKVFGGPVEVMNDEQKCYYRKLLRNCTNTFDEVWLVIDEVKPRPKEMQFIRNMLNAGAQGNIHLALMLSSVAMDECGLSMAMVSQAHWYRAVGSYRFEFTDIAEWRR